MPMDYEAAFQRERKARKNAELTLEQKSRELHFANLSLTENIDFLNFALGENKFLLHIGRYSLERPHFRDFLPTIVNDMMRLSEIAFTAYCHFAFDKQQEDFYSPLLCNPDLFATENLTIYDSEAAKAVRQVEPLIREKGRTHFQVVDLLIADKPIDTMIALPIISLGRLSGLIIFFSQSLTDKQNQILGIFKTGIKQLAIIMEHRYQEDKLLASYQEISAANNALKETQKQLVQSEKMATVGQLSAGITHEIHNPMGFIKSNTRSLASYIEDLTTYVNMTKQLTDLSCQSNDDRVNALGKTLDKLWHDIDMEFLLEDSQSLLKESQQGVERVIDIVDGLKRFSRQSDNKKAPCDINQIIEEALKLAQNELKFKGNISKQLIAVPPINGNSGELLQVFLNLFVNAAHAMDEQGELTILVNDNAGGASIKVSDNGCGIDKQHLKSIFDPFFTTKEIGIGTGLGLSISYGIIEDHQGTIGVSSEVGKGTEFNIWLPYNAA